MKLRSESVRVGGAGVAKGCDYTGIIGIYLIKIETRQSTIERECMRGRVIGSEVVVCFWKERELELWFADKYLDEYIYI